MKNSSKHIDFFFGKIFFCWSTALLLFSFRCVALLYAFVSIRQSVGVTLSPLPQKTQLFFTKLSKRSFIKPNNKNYYRAFIALVTCLFLISPNIIAQTTDPAGEVADSSSLHHLVNRDDETESRSQMHVYDTSENFFNSKEDNNELYSNEKFKAHATSDSSIKKFRNSDDFWYVKAVEKFKQNVVRLRTDKGFRDSLAREGYLEPDEQVFKSEQRTNLITYPPWLQFVVWTIVIGVFVYALAYFLSANKISLFTRDAASTTPSTSAEKEDIFHLTYQNLLQKAYAEKNYRQAVRILYLQTLKLMSEKNLIKFQPDYTNLNYLSQLSRTNYFKDFFNITHHYEYAWYGKFEVTEERFDKIKSDFESIRQKITNA